MAVRGNVTTLSATERQAYVAAVKKLKAAPSEFTPKTSGRTGGLCHKVERPQWRILGSVAQSPARRAGPGSFVRRSAPDLRPRSYNCELDSLTFPSN